MNFFQWGLLIGCLLIIVILILAFINYLRDRKKWNDGKCPKCGAPLYCANPDEDLYKCQNCDYETNIWWTRTIKTF